MTTASSGATATARKPSTIAAGTSASVFAIPSRGAIRPVTTTLHPVRVSRSISSISFSPAPDAESPLADAVSGRASLEVHLSDGSELSGWAFVELPKEHARTLDILNGPETFLAVHSDDRVHLVNRAHVRKVYPLD